MSTDVGEVDKELEERRRRRIEERVERDRIRRVSEIINILKYILSKRLQ